MWYFTTPKVCSTSNTSQQWCHISCCYQCNKVAPPAGERLQYNLKTNTTQHNLPDNGGSQSEAHHHHHHHLHQTTSVEGCFRTVFPYWWATLLVCICTIPHVLKWCDIKVFIIKTMFMIAAGLDFGEKTGSKTMLKHENKDKVGRSQKTNQQHQWPILELERRLKVLKVFRPEMF